MQNVLAGLDARRVLCRECYPYLRGSCRTPQFVTFMPVDIITEGISLMEHLHHCLLHNCRTCHVWCDAC